MKIKLIIFLTICFVFQNTINSQTKIIKNKDIWYYYDKGYLEDDWYKTTEFSKWKTGKSPIGYGDKKNITNISYGNNQKKKHITKYFKKKIILKNKFLAYEFKIQRDDGAVLYVNGKELFKDNMPNSSISNTTLAISTVKDKEEHLFKQFFFDKSIFKEGENIISVSIHQAYEYSSDCIFSLELIGHTNPEVLSFVLENKNKTNLELEEKIKNLNKKFEIEKIKLHNENLTSTNYNLKVSLFLIGSLFTLSTIIGFFLIINARKKEKELSKNIDSITKKSLEKDKEIITLTTNLLHNKQYYKEIKADIKGITTPDKGNVKAIINQINYVLERDEDWNILKKHFNTVYEGFYDKIIALHPTISETELRHCMFIKLHLQTKEIAKILLIDPRSVQTARYRIKKKMNLKENEDLRDYLLKLS
ncbi:hypothetical protein [uncultured Polaribacter sp.]|uniref:hypothetical protein n=1 Tax=uncultured Polaribacter sp. TaxID=174711 RepID=UPI00259B4A4B|nr:hypothetical protein [uncultured Polaribacter sp.]